MAAKQDQAMEEVRASRKTLEEQNERIRQQNEELRAQNNALKEETEILKDSSDLRSILASRGSGHQTWANVAAQNNRGPSESSSRASQAPPRR